MEYKQVRTGNQAVNNVLKSTQRMVTKAGNCFVAGTEILTVDGIKNIEDIQVGDWVIADDPTTPGGIEAKQVLDTFVRETDALVDLYIDGEVISTTGEHPFWVADKGWVEAKDLVVGSLLLTGDGRVVDVDKIEKREGKFPVYNFKVEGIPTYFVSELGVLVHNADCGPNNINWSPKSKPTFGHIFERHGAGSKTTEKLRGRAASNGQEQGQWTDNNKAAEFLKSIHGQLTGSETIKIPEGLGQVIMPDGSVVPTTWATIVPQPGGVYKTAYPVLKP